MPESLLLNASAIAEAANGSVNVLRKFDRHGLFPAPGEDGKAFAARLTHLAEALADLDKSLKKNGTVLLKKTVKYR